MVRGLGALHLHNVVLLNKKAPTFTNPSTIFLQCFSIEPV